jgi:hypothetical protein
MNCCLAAILTIPQTFLMIQIGFRLFNITVGIANTLLISAVVFFYSYLVYHLAIPFYLNILIIFAFLVLSLAWLEKMYWQYVLVCTILGNVIYILLGQLGIIIALNGLNMTMTQILGDFVLMAKVFLLLVLLLLGILAIIVKKKIFLYDLNNYEVYKYGRTI